MFNPADALFYHGRAAFHRNSLWKGFRTELDQWLRTWAPKERALLLVEPRAGYCLEKDLISRFDRITVIEPDQLDTLLFRYRFREQLGGKKLDHDHHNYLRSTDGLLDSSEINHMLDRYPDHAILFCNVLGRIRLDHEEEALSSRFSCWKWNLAAALKERSWASFHDRISGHIAPTAPAQAPSGPNIESLKVARIGLGSSIKHLSEKELLELFYQHASASARLQLMDHLTGDFAAWLPRTYFQWENRPGYHHLVEAIRST